MDLHPTCVEPTRQATVPRDSNTENDGLIVYQKVRGVPHGGAREAKLASMLKRAKIRMRKKKTCTSLRQWIISSLSCPRVQRRRSCRRHSLFLEELCICHHIGRLFRASDLHIRDQLYGHSCFAFEFIQRSAAAAEPEMLNARMFFFFAAALILAGKSNQPARAIIKWSLASWIKTFRNHAASLCELVSMEFSMRSSGGRHEARRPR
jgi:hypothetical protein